MLKLTIIIKKKEYIRLLTGKFETILILNALVIPQIRKAKFDCEYLIPHVGLFRISSALQKES